jgi:hypothetical protein
LSQPDTAPRHRKTRSETGAGAVPNGVTDVTDSSFAKTLMTAAFAMVRCVK